MRSWSRLGLLFLVLGACEKPPVVDPAEVAYRHAMDLFAKASADTQDLTYRNPRFDEVLAALALVPQGDELRTKADRLAEQIRQARAEADRADGESNSKLDEALAAPSFNPQPRDAPFPMPTKPGAAKGVAPAQPMPVSPGYSGTPYPSGGQHPPPSSKVPSFYKQYLSANNRPGTAPPGVAGPSGEESAALGPPKPGANVTTTDTAAAPPAEAAPVGTPTLGPPPGPPPVFGLPGPAGRAIMGGH